MTVDLSGPDRSSYEELKFHWGSAYVIIHRRRGPFMAVRLDTKETLIADRADELEDIIRDNYAAHPVPRVRR